MRLENILDAPRKELFEEAYTPAEKAKNKASFIKDLKKMFDFLFYLDPNDKPVIVKPEGIPDDGLREIYRQTRKQKNQLFFQNINLFRMKRTLYTSYAYNSLADINSVEGYYHGGKKLSRPASSSTLTPLEFSKIVKKITVADIDGRNVSIDISGRPSQWKFMVKDILRLMQDKILSGDIGKTFYVTAKLEKKIGGKVVKFDATFTISVATMGEINKALGKEETLENIGEYSKYKKDEWPKVLIDFVDKANKLSKGELEFWKSGGGIIEWTFRHNGKAGSVKFDTRKKEFTINGGFNSTEVFYTTKSLADIVKNLDAIEKDNFKMPSWGTYGT